MMMKNRIKSPKNRRYFFFLGCAVTASSFLLLVTNSTVESFEFPKKIFPGVPTKAPSPTGSVLGGGGGNKASTIAAKKSEILNSISNTDNGKKATPQQQIDVLNQVRELELLAKPPNDLLTNVELANQYLDGVWYLQYTSPSEIISDDGIITTSDEDQKKDDDDSSSTDKAWKVDPQGDDDVPISSSFQAKGTVSAAGVTVDTSNKVVEQILDIANSRVTNRIQIDNDNKVVATVAGKYRPSDNVPNRAIVAFDTANIAFGDNDLVISFGWVFAILAILFRGGNKDSGWLETTFVDDTMRIGRGNKGTLFVLTRDI